MPTYTLQQRIFMYISYVITSSCREVVRRFQANYPGVRVPNREAVRSHVNKIKKCLVLLAVSLKCVRIHYNKEYSWTIRMLLHHIVGKL